jgi:hypothetical protein
VHLSRREFLKYAGVAVLGSAAAGLPTFLHTTPSHAGYGRALSALPVYAAPSGESKFIKRLWPDTVAPLLDIRGDWYQLDNGYAKRSGLQPVSPMTETAINPTLPFWAEVGGAVAIVREWCAADAPMIARIGHGGVAQVVDMLSGDNTAWYALADEDEFLGWSQAGVWQPVIENIDHIAAQVYINTHAGQIDVVQKDRSLLRAPIALGAALTPGTYALSQRKRSVKLRVDNASDGYGVPWKLDCGAYSLTGAYWHNEFGTQQRVQGASIQVTPPVARWLYHHLPQGTPVIIW